jgi:hypothetical protein
MAYIFSRALGAAQEHLLPRFDEDSPVRFTSVREMPQHLASSYFNLNKVRDAQYEFHRLRMQATRTFSEFQATFLHLAGEADPEVKLPNGPIRQASHTATTLLGC